MYSCFHNSTEELSDIKASHTEELSDIKASHTEELCAVKEFEIKASHTDVSHTCLVLIIKMLHVGIYRTDTYSQKKMVINYRITTYLYLSCIILKLIK